MKRTALTLLALLALTIAAPAQRGGGPTWNTIRGEDPMTDKKFVMAVAEFPSAHVMVSFKCWQGGGTVMALSNGETYSERVASQGDLDFLIRIDKGQPVKITMKPVNMSNMLTYLAYADEEDGVVPLIKMLGEAKQRVVLAMPSGGLFVNDVRGAAAAVKAMFETCNLDKGTPS